MPFRAQGRKWELHSNWANDLPESVETFKQLMRQHVLLMKPSDTTPYACFSQIDPAQPSNVDLTIEIAEVLSEQLSLEGLFQSLSTARIHWPSRLLQGKLG
jgi:hypothetical protein